MLNPSLTYSQPSLHKFWEESKLKSNLQKNFINEILIIYQRKYFIFARDILFLCYGANNDELLYLLHFYLFEVITRAVACVF